MATVQALQKLYKEKFDGTVKVEREKRDVMVSLLSDEIENMMVEGKFDALDGNVIRVNIPSGVRNGISVSEILTHWKIRNTHQYSLVVVNWQETSVGWMVVELQINQHRL